jgi:calcineurin-like phosphoesterase family protein
MVAMIWVWSDTHFNHAGIIRYCSRGDDSVEAMNERLIERWNAAVRPQDEIYLLGDFGFGKDLSGIFDRLRGQKHLVIGNHDEKNPAVLKLPWKTMRDIVTLREQGVRAVACHYPLETWKSADRGYLMLHGHSHGTLKRKAAHRFDVGADVRPAPVTLQQLAEEASRETFEAADHHGDL